MLFFKMIKSFDLMVVFNDSHNIMVNIYVDYTVCQVTETYVRA